MKNGETKIKGGRISPEKLRKTEGYISLSATHVSIRQNAHIKKLDTLSR